MTSTTPGAPPVEPVEITAVQQMLSATSGSLLTGLLMTPLDVVRVRWQSQGVQQQQQQQPPPPPPPPRRPPLPATPTAPRRPPNLGVTACCREVFFMSNHAADVCAAGVPQSGILHHGGTGAAPPGCAVEQTRQRTFTSTLDGLRKIARHEGVATLWRGLSPTLVMAVPGNIIYFTGYEWLRFDGASPVQRAVPDEYASLAAGAVARVLAATAISPVEMFRTRLQASHGASARGHVVDTFHSLREAVGRDGYRALWRGLTLTLWRDVPFSGMYWWGYETIRGKLTDWREYQRGRAWEPEPECASRGRRRRRSQSRETHAETFRDSFVAGAASGAFASVVTTPFDVGKTRTQVYRDAGVQAAAGPGEKRPGPQSMARLLWHIFRAEGVAGLFTGWIPRTLKVAPACAIMISSYEAGKRVFRSMNEQALLRDQENRRDDEPGNP